MRFIRSLALLLVFAATSACQYLWTDYDVLIRGGTIYDGGGGAPYVGDVAIKGDTIVIVDKAATGARARRTIDATGLAVSPGFINMLSWATESLIIDGDSQSDIRQGVTLEVFGEGNSMGPVGESSEEKRWRTLGEYLEFLERKGVSTNVASFIGATTVRTNVIGFDDRPPTPDELAKMRELVRVAMEEGAMGVGSSLIYAPAFYAETAELIELCKVASAHGGMYISHMRSEGARLLEAIDELLTIAREARIAAEIYHFKALGRPNWGKLALAIEKVERARADGLKITANMYPYVAGATGLSATIPPWAHEGGLAAMIERLKDPEVRRRVEREMITPSDEWENLLLAAGPEGVMLSGFESEALRPYTAKRLAEVARLRGKSPEATALDLVIEDGSRVDTIYFFMSEDNIRTKVALPWMSFGSDAGSMAPEGVFLDSSVHPRSYGTFARILGRFSREEGIVPLEEAIRRLSSLPAENLKVRRRGRLRPDYFADVVVFDPGAITDHATFEDPHRHSTGVVHVFVNGVQVLEDGDHTGAKPGRVVRGPGWTGWSGGH